MKMKEDNNKKVILKEVGVSAIKGAIGAIPFAGTALNEVIFEGRSRLKQERINNFILMLQGYMENVSESDTDFNYMKTEEFSDIIESVLIRVSNTRSLEKRKRFRNLLIGQITIQEKPKFSEHFLDIINQIEEIQILILRNMEMFSESCNTSFFTNYFELQNEILKQKEKLKIERERQKNGYANNFISAQKELSTLQLKANLMHKTIMEGFDKYDNATIHGLEWGEYDFFVLDLISKGLLRERLVPVKEDATNQLPVAQIKEITTYGIEFLKFIKEKNTEPNNKG